MEVQSSDVIYQGSIINKCYIVSVYDSLEDTKLEALCENTVKQAYVNEVDGVIFSFINVNVIDTYTIKLFIEASKTISLLGVRVVWTGLNPGVVSAILDFNIGMEGITISHSIEQGIKLINLK